MAGNLIPDGFVTRTELATVTGVVQPVPLHNFRVWDALQTNLPGTAAADDLALIGGTFGSASPVIRSGDGKATTLTQYARVLAVLPRNYKAGGSLKVRMTCKMVTTVSSTTASVDVEAYKVSANGAVGSDLCTTSATTINSLTAADKDFTITATGLSPGDQLDIRVRILITDSATATAVIGEIGSFGLVMDSLN